MLTGKEIFNAGFIKGALEQNVQQQGVDVRVSKISKVFGSGIIPVEGKTQRAQTSELPLFSDDGWRLQPGYYEVEFEEGCEMPNNIGLQFKTRSSLVRCGCDIRSGHFDPGFKTDHMGAFMEVSLPVTIYKGACLAQVITFESNSVDNLYDGQWQDDKQRKTSKTKKNDKTSKQQA